VYWSIQEDATFDPLRKPRERTLTERARRTSDPNALTVEYARWLSQLEAIGPSLAAAGPSQAASLPHLVSDHAALGRIRPSSAASAPKIEHRPADGAAPDTATDDHIATPPPGVEQPVAPLAPQGVRQRPSSAIPNRSQESTVAPPASCATIAAAGVQRRPSSAIPDRSQEPTSSVAIRAAVAPRKAGGVRPVSASMLTSTVGVGDRVPARPQSAMGGFEGRHQRHVTAAQRAITLAYREPRSEEHHRRFRPATREMVTNRYHVKDGEAAREEVARRARRVARPATRPPRWTLDRVRERAERISDEQLQHKQSGPQ